MLYNLFVDATSFRVFTNRQGDKISNLVATTGPFLGT